MARKKYTEEQKEALKETHNRKLSLLDMSDDIKAGFKKLIAQNNERAILQGQKQIYDVEKYQCQEFEDKVICWIIKMAESSRQVKSILSDLFEMPPTTAEKAYKRCIHQYQLETPYDRQKRLKKESHSDIVEKFQKGTLSEMELLHSQMLQTLERQSMAEYSNEYVNLQKQVIEITRRIDEIKERERIESERSQYDIADLVDAQLLNVSPKMITDFKDSDMCKNYTVAQLEAKKEEEVIDGEEDRGE